MQHCVVVTLLNVLIHAYLMKQSKVCMVLKVKKLEMIIVSPFFTLAYDMLLKPYGGVSRHTQELAQKRLQVVKPFFIF